MNANPKVWLHEKLVPQYSREEQRAEELATESDPVTFAPPRIGCIYCDGESWTVRTWDHKYFEIHRSHLPRYEGEFGW